MGHNLPVICYLKKKNVHRLPEITLCIGAGTYTTNKWNKFVCVPATAPAFLLPSPHPREKEELESGKINDLMASVCAHDEVAQHDISSGSAGVYELSFLWRIHLP